MVKIKSKYSNLNIIKSGFFFHFAAEVFFLNSLSHQMVQTIGSLFSFGVYYPQCCLDAVKCFSCPKLRNICRERHIVRRLCFSTDQKELPNKRGNLKSSYAEVPTYHSNDSESEGKIM